MRPLRFALFMLCLWLSLAGCAQRNRILNPDIASLQVVAGNNWLSMPVIGLGEGVPVNIAFDDLTHEYRRYAYKVEHCNADWSTSGDLFVSDYIDGFNADNVIEHVEQSINTNMLYTHYRFQIPNERCKLKMSGNYRVTIYDANDDDKAVAECCFMVVEPRMGIKLSVDANTDKGINSRWQQVAMEVKYGGGLSVTDVQRQIYTVVMQNGRWDNAVVNAKPQFVMGDGLRWSHNAQLVFEAGNEYRKFEMLDVRHANMGVEKIDWDGEAYHAYLWPDEPRGSYVFDEDANGAFYIRNSDNRENNSTSEYVHVHFTLRSPRLEGGVFVNGAWTNDQLAAPYKMLYDEGAQCYRLSLLLKQGYYSYQYVWQQSNGQIATVPSEGSFYQTENRYQALVYYRKLGERADRLVGFAEIRR
ncbi:MAG: DUF5103 domain-containing protein [Prevotella sp.]